ncbi:MAG: hypothetical protein GY722_13770 [bacterium]|nr:hypothetical protein [bacterium]
MRCQLEVVVDLRHVAGDKHLEAIGLNDQSTELFLIGGCDIWLNVTRFTERVPVTGVE